MSKCTSAYVRLTDIMHPATLLGVGDNTQLYFAIFAAFKESMTLNLVLRSFQVIRFGGNNNRHRVFLRQRDVTKLPIQVN